MAASETRSHDHRLLPNGNHVEQKKFASSADSIHLLSSKIQTMETLISSMFSTIASLKHAYLQLQSAHVPYDRLKLEVADKAMVREFQRMSELKRSYNQKMAAIATSSSSNPSSWSSSPSSSPSSCLHQGASEVLGDGEKSMEQKRDEEDSNSSSETAKKAKSKTKLNKKERMQQTKGLLEAEAEEAGVCRRRKPRMEKLLEGEVLRASEASRSFAKILIGLMKAARWDMAAAAEAIEAGVRYARKSHTKFAIESYVNHRMLKGFDSASFEVHGDGAIAASCSQYSQEQCFEEYKKLAAEEAMDPLELYDADPMGSFARYCRKRFLDVVHPTMEESFFGDLRHRKKVEEGGHPRSQLYGSFMRLAMAMWRLKRLAMCFDPPARIFAAEKGVDFSPLYMERIVQRSQEMAMDLCSEGGGGAKVAMTVMPGFRVQGTVIKCQVYLHNGP